VLQPARQAFSPGQPACFPNPPSSHVSTLRPTDVPMLCSAIAAVSLRWLCPSSAWTSSLTATSRQQRTSRRARRARRSSSRRVRSEREQGANQGGGSGDGGVLGHGNIACEAQGVLAVVLT